MAITDKILMNNIVKKSNNFYSMLEKQNISHKDIEHPFDSDIVESIRLLSDKMTELDDEFRIFYYASEVKTLWKKLVEKSIKCLRNFDENEPFLDNSLKKPLAYGIDDLEKYFLKYIEFESMLYGSGKYYRDHVVHVFRVWLLGMHSMFSSNFDFLKKSQIDKKFDVNTLEKLSIWTLISLSHDLGYPLEKAQGIIDKTKDMMQLFVVNPAVNMDLSFNGVQTNMNDFVLRFMSSKMIEIKNSRTKKEDIKYVARLQPKYYFKFQKSLERHAHGVISALIIYKLLIYFLESDFNTNEDYKFSRKEARQFHIRREILRSISSHTCPDIYHMNLYSFSFLLIMCDDCQGWGRKQISNLYLQSSSKYELNNLTLKQDNVSKENICKVEEEFDIKEKFDENNLTLKNAIGNILMEMNKKFYEYKIILRDGPDTSNRDFDFIKQSIIKCGSVQNFSHI